MFGVLPGCSSTGLAGGFGLRHLLQTARVFVIETSLRPPQFCGPQCFVFLVLLEKCLVQLPDCREQGLGFRV